MNKRSKIHVPNSFFLYLFLRIWLWLSIDKIGKINRNKIEFLLHFLKLNS